MKRLILWSVALAAVLASPAGAADRIKIGLSFPDYSIERWVVERDAMTKLLGEKGFEVLSQVADRDPKRQNDQIRAMVGQGAKVIIVVAEDAELAAQVVDELAKRGVKVIAYDRLIRTPRIAAYVSFDNVEVGRAQARGILAVKDAGRFVLLGGSPTDNNAHLVRAGQLEALKPAIDAGKVKIVADPWVENWDEARARQVMQTVLSSTGGAVDAVVASNDGTALGALEALKAAGLAGKIPISGQDASQAGCNSIALGELTVTILKDVRQLAPIAADLAARLAHGEKSLGLPSCRLAELAADRNLGGTAPCKLLPVTAVTKSNLKQVVVDSGFQPYDGVYRNVPNPPPR